EQVIDIALVPEPVLEHERQGTAAVRVGVGPYQAAIAQIPGGLALDKRRVREQRDRDRLQRKTGAELAYHVGFAAIVEIGLHGAGAQHHVETEPALFWHVIAHNPIAALWHPRHFVAPRQRVEPETDHAKTQ